MQSEKPVKKTRKTKEEKASPEAAAEASKSRRPKAASAKKNDITEVAAAKHHHRPVSEPAVVPAAEVVDAVGLAVPSNGAATTLEREIKHEDIAAVAYSYWVARGHAHGSSDEDWARAEKELRERR